MILRCASDGCGVVFDDEIQDSTCPHTSLDEIREEQDVDHQSQNDFIQEANSRNVHVYPEWEGSEHALKGLACLCNPEIFQGCLECTDSPSTECWRCQGRGLVPAERVGQPIVVVHRILRTRRTISRL